jgi:hypothetical protein
MEKMSMAEGNQEIPNFEREQDQVRQESHPELSKVQNWEIPSYKMQTSYLSSRSVRWLNFWWTVKPDPTPDRQAPNGNGTEARANTRT